MPGYLGADLTSSDVKPTAYALLPSLDQSHTLLDHDLADALLGAYTAWLHALGSTETLGLAEEGQIILPKENEAANLAAPSAFVGHRPRVG